MKNLPPPMARIAATSCPHLRGQAHPVRYRCVAAAVCLLAMRAPSWGADALAPGADLSDCRSALRPGPTICSDIDGPQAGAAADAMTGRTGPRQTPGLEDRVDAYLASYGKPPREAVRALLDPSEENIRAYLRKQDETLAIAAYVAARMTALQVEQRQPAAGIGPVSPGDPGSFQQIRVWLVTEPRDAEAQEALMALRNLARQMPLLQGGVQLVGSLAPPQLREEIARIDPVLSVGVLAPGAVDRELLPYVHIEDMRSRRSVSVGARSLTSEQLARDIAALRNTPTGLAAGAAAPVDNEARP